LKDDIGDLKELGLWLMLELVLWQGATAISTIRLPKTFAQNDWSNAFAQPCARWPQNTTIWLAEIRLTNHLPKRLIKRAKDSHASLYANEDNTIGPHIQSAFTIRSHDFSKTHGRHYSFDKFNHGSNDDKFRPYFLILRPNNQINPPVGDCTRHRIDWGLFFC